MADTVLDGGRLMTREELLKTLLSQPQMIQYALHGYDLYWCRPHLTFKLYKGSEWSLNGVPVGPHDVPACQEDREPLEGCENVFFTTMTDDDLELAIRIMSEQGDD